MSYRAKTVSELTGIPKSTLLAWERRYGLVSPDRANNRYREYTDEDVAQLRAIKALIDRGYKVSEAILMAAKGAPRDEPRAALLAALTQTDHSAADAVLERLFAWSYSDLIRRLFFPVLRDVGEAWERGEITVAQEHFASSYIRMQMASMLARLGGGPADGPAAVLAAAEGEQHSIGVKGLAIELALRGWRVTFFGANTPLDSLLEHLRQSPPDIVCVGTQHTQPELLSYVRALRAGAPATTRVVVGGGALPEKPPEIPGVLWARSFSEVLALKPSR